jgi:hypothetical protein
MPDDILERLQLDPGRRTIGELIQERAAAVHEIRALRGEIHKLMGVRNRGNASATGEAQRFVRPARRLTRDDLPMAGRRKVSAPSPHRRARCPLAGRGCRGVVWQPGSRYLLSVFMSSPSGVYTPGLPARCWQRVEMMRVCILECLTAGGEIEVDSVASRSLRAVLVGRLASAPIPAQAIGAHRV